MFVCEGLACCRCVLPGLGASVRAACLSSCGCVCTWVQVVNVFKTGIVQQRRRDSYKEGGVAFPRVHGLVYAPGWFAAAPSLAFQACAAFSPSLACARACSCGASQARLCPQRFDALRVCVSVSRPWLQARAS